MKAKHHAQYVEMGGKERRDQLNIKFPEFAAKTKVRNEAVTSTLPVCSRRPGLARARGCKRASTAAWCQSCHEVALVQQGCSHGWRDSHAEWDA